MTYQIGFLSRDILNGSPGKLTENSRPVSREISGPYPGINGIFLDFLEGLPEPSTISGRKILTQVPQFFLVSSVYETMRGCCHVAWTMETSRNPLISYETFKECPKQPAERPLNTDRNKY